MFRPSGCRVRYCIWEDVEEEGGGRVEGREEEEKMKGRGRREREEKRKRDGEEGGRGRKGKEGPPWSTSEALC